MACNVVVFSKTLEGLRQPIKEDKMNFIKLQNQIVNFEQICGVEYKKFDKETQKILGYMSRCSVFTTDGRETIFTDKNADKIWDLLISVSTQEFSE